VPYHRVDFQYIPVAGIERESNLKKPFAAYSGDDPYVFVCYAHKDSAIVYADLVHLRDNGVNIWYDEGIPAGTAWRGEIAGAIKGAQKFIYYVSEASLKSSHCLREVDYALSQELEIIPVYLETCVLPTELEFGLNRVQALFRHQDGRFMERLLQALRGNRGLAMRRPAARRRKPPWAPLLVLATIVLAMLIWLQWEKPADIQTTDVRPSAAPSAYEHYLEGLSLMERWDKDDNLDRAIGLFHEAAGIDPDFALAYARLAEALRLRHVVTRQGNWLEEAAAYANQALRLNPGLAPVQVTVGQVQAAQGNTDLAFAAFERALKIDPNDAAANQSIAKVYESKGRLDAAEAAFQKAIALDSDSLLFRDSYANFLFRQGRFDDAAGQWRGVIRLAPDHFGALVNLGSALSELGKLSEAITMYERAIEIRPNYMAYVNLGTAYGRAERYSNAVTAFETALEIDDSDWLAWGNLAYAYSWQDGMDRQALENFDRAIELAEAARQQKPRDPFVHSDLALYYAKTDRTELARQRMETALILSPESGEILASAAEVYELAGQRDQAIEMAQKALDKGFPQQRLHRNPELAALRTDPRMQDRRQIE
jgi:tetratricopeptide (TPR) repeat protein